MRTSKTKRDVMQMPGTPAVFCITHPRMSLEQYAKHTGQTLRAVQHQANEGKFILAEGKYGKYQEINMVAEFMKEYEAALKALTDLVRKNGRMTFGELQRVTGLTVFTARHYLSEAERCGDLYQAGRSGIFPSERDFRIWKRKQDDARVERFLNARLIAGEPYDRSRNSICEECRNSYVMQRILAFYRGYQQGVIGK